MTYAAIALAIIVTAFVLVWFLNRPQLIVVDAPISDDFPVDGFSHDEFESLLAGYVDSSGRVDYERWHRSEADVRRLSGYLAAVAAFSPDNAAQRFAKRSDELAYWLNAYNAYVIFSVLDHWPLESVTDVRAPLEVVTGLGFFWRQRFLFGERALSLYAVENDIIAETFRDPRIHFVLNCASESCPIARPELPTGDDLEPFLARAAIDFVSDEANVRVDRDEQQIVLSDIFKWYEKQFANDLRRRGITSDRPLVDYVIGIAPQPVADALRDTEGFAVVFPGYDWGLNNTEPVN